MQNRDHTLRARSRFTASGRAGPIRSPGFSRSSVREYELVICTEGARSDAWGDLSWAYLFVGRYELAICGYEKCLENEPAHVGCLHGLARARNYKELQSGELYKLLSSE